MVPRSPDLPPVTHRPNLEPIAPPITHADVQRYFAEFRSNPVGTDYSVRGFTQQWAAPPTIRISTGTPPIQRQTILRAVHGINAYLPPNWHLVIGPDLAPVSSTSDVPDGVIFIDHTIPLQDPEWQDVWRHWNVPRGHPGFATNRTNEDGIVASVVYAAVEDRHSRRTSPSLGDTDLDIIQHELLHSLGLIGHLYDSSRLDGYDDASGSRIGEINSSSSSFYSFELPRLDGAALYQNIFGDWSETTMRIEGQWDRGQFVTHGIPVAYGVDWQNGFAIPWTEGHSTPGASRAPQGTWRGGVVGITPDGRAVTGRSSISVNFGGMNGSIDFDGLEYADTTQWGDGELDYAIQIHDSAFGPRFGKSGGDAGELYGRFVAENRAAVGTLERSDLAAAFGASR